MSQYAQPQYPPQPVYPQAGYPQPIPGQAVYPQPMAGQPAYPQQVAYPPGYTQPTAQVTYVTYQEVPPPVQQTIIVTERQPNHCAHFLVFCLTGGLWLPCWIGTISDKVTLVSHVL